MILKILMIFQVFEVKNKAKMLLGAEAYNRVFPQAKAVETQEETKKKVTRIIKGEVVGRPLATLAKGKREEQATMTPELCPHPEDKMKREGNRNSRTWVCLQCLQRWERTPLEELNNPTTPGRDSDLVTFGMHVGKTYREVFNDPTHAQWIMMSAEQDPNASPEMKRLARYLVKKEASQTWEEVPQKDPMDADDI